MIYTISWIIKELNDLNTQLDQLTKKYLFHEIANKIYHFVWHSYCDWYIEIIKQNFDNEKYAEEIKNVSGWTFIQVLKIIHPIMPFISEKLWRSLVDNKSYLMNQVYQNYLTNNSFSISHYLFALTFI